MQDYVKRIKRKCPCWGRNILKYISDKRLVTGIYFLKTLKCQLKRNSAKKWENKMTRYFLEEHTWMANRKIHHRSSTEDSNRHKKEWAKLKTGHFKLLGLRSEKKRMKKNEQRLRDSCNISKQINILIIYFQKEKKEKGREITWRNNGWTPPKLEETWI